MTDTEIAALKERVKEGDVWWNDGDNHCIKVNHVNLKWVEFKEQPDLVEPAAMLHGGGAVALYNVDADSFVSMCPCLPV